MTTEFVADSHQLTRSELWLFRLEQAMALVSGLAVFSLMLLAVVSVAGRTFFAQPIPGYVDWIEQILPLIAFLGLSYVHRLGGHIRMDLFLRFAPPRLLWVCELVTTVLMLTVALLLLWGSAHHFARSFDPTMPLWSTDSSLDIRLPLWPAKLLAPIAFALVSARLGFHTILYALAVRHPHAPHPALPVIENINQVAEKSAHGLADDGSEHAGDNAGGIR